MLSPQVYLRNAEAFVRHNRLRLDRLRASLSDRKRTAFDLIPFLLHEDNPDLPGGKEAPGAPSGIFCYDADARVRELVRQQFPSFAASRAAKPKRMVKFVALMGSAGTIAFTQDSDLDFWVGVEKGALDLDAQLLLQEKLSAIERWTIEKTGLEAHFFIADIAKIRSDDYGALTQESCGSALGVLLKDEFYRTGLFVAGKLPLYWAMPVGIRDADYTFTIPRLSALAGFPHDDFVDLGFVRTIGFAEHFGAMLWQLLKGMRSPFKSVLKIALLDKYCSEGARAVPLCELFKNQVLLSPGGDPPDPYLFMIDELRMFYDQQHLTSVRQLVEECFLVRCLLSVGERDSRLAEHFMRLGKLWGWSADSMTEFAEYRQWDHFRREDFHRRIVGFMIDTYRRMRGRTRGEAVRISDRDLTVVGKKLKSFLEYKADKVPFEFSLFKARDIAAIRLYQQTGNDGKPTWFAGVRVLGTGASQYQLTREVHNPVVGCAWCSLNGFFHSKASLTINGKTSLPVKEAAALIGALDDFFPREEGENLNIQELLGDGYVSHLFVVPNWDRPEWSAGLASVLALLRTTEGELLFAQHAGTDCEKWLTEEILLGRVGTARLALLTWKVHLLRGDVSSTRRASESLTQRIRGLTAGGGSR